MNFYQRVRPFITRGDIISEESVKNNEGIVKRVLEREEAKHSKSQIMKAFYYSLNGCMRLATSKKKIDTVIDIGCGRGENIAKLALDWPDISFLGVDIVDELIAIATEKHCGIENLVFLNENFLYLNVETPPGLITCLETLEHIEDRFLQTFIEKLFSLSQNVIILSVPREPLWCIANILRCKYLSRLGNTPSHLQHWTKRSFEALVLNVANKKWGKHIEMIPYSPFKLWTMVLLINHNTSNSAQPDL